MNYTLQINRFESNNKLVNYVFNLPEAEINAKIEEYKTPGFVKLLMRVLDNNSRIVKSIELKETPVSTTTTLDTSNTNSSFRSTKTITSSSI